MFRSTALRNYIGNGGSYYSAFNGLAVIKVYSGTPAPADADQAIGSATLLCTVTKNGGVAFPGDCLHFDPAPVAGILAKLASEAWKCLGANVINGTPTFARMVIQSTDTGVLVTNTQFRMQFTVGAGGAEANTGTGLCVAGTDYEYTYGTLTLPAGS